MKYILLFTLSLIVLSCGTSRNNEKDNSTPPASQNLLHPAGNFNYFSVYGPDNEWYLEFSFGYTLLLNNPSGSFGRIVEKLPTTTFEKGLTQEVYTVADDRGYTLEVCLSSEGCKEHERLARIEVSDKNGKVVFKEEGCGFYHNGSGLEDIWVIESINGATAAKKPEKTDLPVLEIHLEGNRLFGKFGCRRINGGINMQENTFFASLLIAPDFKCSETPGETKLMTLFGDKQFTYQIKNNRLILKDTNNELIFRKID